MSATHKITLLLDADGRVLAADLGGVAASKDGPTAKFAPDPGQHVVAAELPREALELSGRELHRFLSKVQVRWPAEVVIPKLEIRRKHE